MKESVSFVYADGGDRWLDEESPLLADLGLLAPTVEGENIALELATDGEAVVLRFGLFYGGVGNRAIDEMLKLAKVRSSMLAGNPDAYMSSIHADDAAAAVVAALDGADRYLQRDRRRVDDATRRARRVRGRVPPAEVAHDPGLDGEGLLPGSRGRRARSAPSGSRTRSSATAAGVGAAVSRACAKVGKAEAARREQEAGNA